MKTSNNRKLIKKKAMSEPKSIFIRAVIIILVVNSLISLFMITLCDSLKYSGNIDAINYLIFCFNLILTMPLFINYKKLILMNARDEILTFKELFTGAKQMISYTLFFALVAIFFTCTLYILSLLPFVGNILAITIFIYVLPVFIFLPFVFLDNKNESKNDIILKTFKLLENRRVEFYGMLLSFTGWILLGFITAGVLFIWVIPYMSIAFSYQYLNWKYECEYEKVKSLSNGGVILINILVFALILSISFVNVPSSFSTFINDTLNYEIIKNEGNSSLEYGGAVITFDKPKGYTLVSKSPSVKTYTSEEGNVIQYSIYMADKKDIIKMNNDSHGKKFTINYKGKKLDGYHLTTEDAMVIYYPKGAFIVTVYLSGFDKDIDKNKLKEYLNIY